MSLVGTRPPTVDEWDKYELHHRARLATKPGLTGMWQVSGRSNITDLGSFLIIVICRLVKIYISNLYVSVFVSFILSVIVYGIVLILFKNNSLKLILNFIKRK